LSRGHRPLLLLLVRAFFASGAASRTRESRRPAARDDYPRGAIERSSGGRARARWAQQQAARPSQQVSKRPAQQQPGRLGPRSPAQQPHLHLSLSPLNMPFAHPLGAPSKAAPSQPAVVDASALPPSPPAGRPQPGTAAAAVRSIRPLSEAMSLPSTRSSRPARRRSTTETSRMSRPCTGPGPSEPPRPEQDHLSRARLLTRRDLLARSSYSASTLR
jgi:hypothetical protein